MATRPAHYTLHFRPDLGARRFSGSAVIEAVAGSPTSTITMDAAELAIRACAVTWRGKKVASRARLEPRDEKLVIRLGRRVSGRVRISLDFEGTLNDRLLGFYSSEYARAGRKMRIATTQFEAADARRAFPCWDEPAAKATFDVAITASKALRTVSNMPETSSKTSSGMTTHTFARTPPMSTYLLYLGVGDFESISGTYRGVRVGVIATRGNARRGRFALGLAKRLLAEYEAYFGAKYPLPKLDLIAIPDFAAGAMENWGAITFRESLLLYDEKTSSTRTKQLIAEVVSHEIAHQWFGNLVTMKWWNDLWLNESFATFMATKFVDKLYPGWAMWEQFAEDTVNTALRLDSLRSTHPIDVDVKSPAQVREIFDAISYDKGGSVLQMIERVVGEPAFRRGLRAYLKKFAYGNAEGADLWRHIGAAARRRLGPFVDSWIRQAGYPLLEVGGAGASPRLTQSRFLLDPRRRRAAQTWQIPVFVRGKKRPLKILSSRSAPAAGLRASGVVNPGRAAFARVMYPRERLEGLRAEAADGRMDAMDAWMIQNDVLALCRAGRRTVDDYLGFAASCATYGDYLVSSGIARNLRFLHRVTAGSPVHAAVSKLLAGHHARMHARLGWSPRRGERHADSILRGEVIMALGVTARDPDTVREAGLRFERFVRRPASLAADLRGPVCSIAVASGGAAAWRRARSLYSSAQTQEEKTRFLASMCAASRTDLLRRTLEFSQSPSVRSQNMHIPVMHVAANPHGAPLVWPWIRRNWAGISRKVGRGNPLLSRVISSVAVASSNPRTASELEAFFARRPVPGTERTVAQSAETIRINSRLFTRAGGSF